MQSLKEKLEIVEEYHEKMCSVYLIEQRRIRDYKDVLELYRKSIPIIDDACEGKTDLVEEVNKVQKIVMEKHEGFLNFWKPYRNLDQDYNREIEDLEKRLNYETKNIKTGGNKAKSIAKYVGNELLSYPIGAFGAGASFMVSLIPFLALEKHTSFTIPDLIAYGLMGASLIVGGWVKWRFTPQVKNKKSRESEMAKLKEDAEFIQSIIEEVYPE